MLNPFRSNPDLTIRPRTFLAAYAAILIAVPALAALNIATLQFLPHPIQTYIQPLTAFHTALAFSPLFAWAGVLMSAPLVWLALRTNTFGWATSVLTGAIIFQANWTLFIRNELGTHISPFATEWTLGTLGAITLALTFWATTIALTARSE